MICPRPVSARSTKQTIPSKAAIAIMGALLGFGILTQDAYAWIAALSEGVPANAPTGPDGLIALLSIITTAISAVWLYLTRLVG